MSGAAGTVFDIQRCSYADGPGIRSTIFMKGCNLHCLWCHNPEGIHLETQYVRYPDRCSRCGRCVKICENHAISGDGSVDSQKCRLCGRCADYCPNGAIKIYGRKMTPPEILELLKKDTVYFNTSGGGVTFSGGECMLQPEFLLETAKLCSSEVISVAIDTAGNVPWKYFEAVEPFTDWFLYDIKAVDETMHKKLTGVSNRLILVNFERLLSVCPKKVIVRIPVIPGANDDSENSEIVKIAEYLNGLPSPREVELLPYHSLGELKREAVGEPPFKTQAPSKEHMAMLKRYFKTDCII